MLTHKQLRQSYIQYFQSEDREHKKIEAAPLVLQGDATTLFTSSGMQPLVPFLSGKESHAHGRRLVNVQPCLRTQDIEEVGDNRHTTFFEMLGNWSLGDYFKDEQLEWIWNYFTKSVGLPANKLHVTVFEGNNTVPRDDESADIWRKLGVPQDHIHFYGVKSNWWSRAGVPENMPTGEIGGPDSEIFYDFGEGAHKGPDSDEDRFLEIGNSVFIQYIKQENGTLSELPLKNVDFGGGLERILAAATNSSDVFRTGLFDQVLTTLEDIWGSRYDDNKRTFRILADHMRAATFLIKSGVTPSNKEHGYVLRRLLRRSAVQFYTSLGVDRMSELARVSKSIVQTYSDDYFTQSDENVISKTIEKELVTFQKTIERGMRMIEKQQSITGKVAFDLFQSYGFPIEITQEIATTMDMEIDLDEFEAEKSKHRDQSRAASASKFKGGLADTSDTVIKYHTATHLLQQVLRDLYGSEVRQEGSNITQDRLRFDVRLDHKPDNEEIQQIEDTVNAKIRENLRVYKLTLPKSEAEKLGAIAFFKEKYADMVNTYCIGGDESNPDQAYSKEFCGGPHVSSTGEIGVIELFKVEKIGSQTIRIYARHKAAS